MKKTLEFTVRIAAPRAAVWQAMLEHPTYEQWTAAFAEGSTYEGSWAQGERIRFVAPSGEGMLAEIAENRPCEYLSIRHLGMVAKDGTADLANDWAPAYENYTYEDAGGGTLVRVAIDVLPEYEGFMRTTFPMALQKLRQVCEARTVSPGS